MVGSALVRLLESEGFGNLVLRTSTELDLRDQHAVNEFFDREKPEYVFHSAARVGGIIANNTYRAGFLYDNLMIATNVIHAAYRTGVRKLLFMGSSCIYPKMAPQPLKEEYLLTGPLEPTNEPYAIAKIAGLKLCETYRQQYGCDFISAMPTNMYGPNDNYDLQNAHVLPALLRKIHTAKVEGAQSVEIWGTGKPLREFLHVDDLANACLFLMNEPTKYDWVNVGSGEEVSIRQLAETIAEVVGYKGAFIFDTGKPDGTPRKLLDSSRIINLGWQPSINLANGIRRIIEDNTIKNTNYVQKTERP